MVMGVLLSVTRDGWRWMFDAHRNGTRRYVVESDELFSAFWS